jgi:hypothetical protein
MNQILILIRLKVIKTFTNLEIVSESPKNLDSPQRKSIMAKNSPQRQSLMISPKRQSVMISPQRQSIMLPKFSERNFEQASYQKDIYSGTDLIDKIFNCSENNIIQLTQNEAEKLSIVLLEFINIEKEKNKLKEFLISSNNNEYNINLLYLDLIF